MGVSLMPLLAEAQPVPRGTTERGQTVATRPRADFDPLGVRLGAFRATAAAELGLGYDDNIFGTRSGTVADGFGSWLAEGGLQSEWSQHAVGASARIEERRYLDEGKQDWTDYSLSASAATISMPSAPLSCASRACRSTSTPPAWMCSKPG